MNTRPGHKENPVPAVPGTCQMLGESLDNLEETTARLLRPIRLAGYSPMTTPELDLVELHERKSGAAITARLIELSGVGSQGLVCLRPELTVGVVRGLIESGGLGEEPVRVHVQGPVYRLTGEAAESLTQINQIGVELLGDASVEADAEVIALADQCLTAAGISGHRIKIGDVGLILEAITAAGLPEETRMAVVETLADAGAAGHGLGQAEEALVHWADWLGDQKSSRAEALANGEKPADHDLERLFHQLVPHVVGRRTDAEILGRLRQKWSLARRLPEALKKAAAVVHEIGAISGPTDDVLRRLQASSAGTLARTSLDRLARLVQLLQSRYGIPASRITLDFSVARGIGFYSGLVFSIHAGSAGAEELAGGGRYDGLAGVLGGKTPADYGVGFAIGLDRAARHAANGKPDVKPPVLIIVLEDAAAEKHAIDLLARLRAADTAARLATPGDDIAAIGEAIVIVSADGSMQVSEKMRGLFQKQKPAE
ncbi:MAG: ATP phosphoribosyltransferase regulatory subunit [bacterium]